MSKRTKAEIEKALYLHDLCDALITDDLSSDKYGKIEAKLDNSNCEHFPILAFIADDGTRYAKCHLCDQVIRLYMRPSY